MSSGILALGVQGNILNSLKINDKISICCPITLYFANSRPSVKAGSNPTRWEKASATQTPRVR